MIFHQGGMCNECQRMFEKAREEAQKENEGDDGAKEDKGKGKGREDSDGREAVDDKGKGKAREDGGGSSDGG